MASTSILALFLLVTAVLSQSIYPSNSSTDLAAASSSPRFLLNGTELPSLPPVRLAPLGEYGSLSHASFLDVQVIGHLANIDASNANLGSIDQFGYLSCDPQAYTGNLDATAVFKIAVEAPRANIIILYSEFSDHCGATGLDQLPTINGILTTTDTKIASMLAGLKLSYQSPGSVTILPDLNSYTNSSSSNYNNPGFNASPTTAVAMIILYSITGIITAIFVVIIITGALRAHRHPERYGPRAGGGVLGRSRQSRARGIARAMLDTLPIVKFGDREGDQTKTPVSVAAAGADIERGRDIEMNPTAIPKPSTETATTAPSDLESQPQITITANGSPPTSTAKTEATEHPTAVTSAIGLNPDGTDIEGHLGCSICTEDFNKGEDIRVLPCNHKFHPDCVDPWLLNVSGTCPLCRIDLRPAGEATEGDADAVRSGSAGEGEWALPLPLGSDPGAGGIGGEGSRRRDTFMNLRQMASLGVGSREERIAALRRLRQDRPQPRERRSSTGAAETTGQDESERRGLARRFRERFRVRTEQNGDAAARS